MRTGQASDIETAARSDDGQCERCGGRALTRVNAPDGSGAWSICICKQCCFTWRSTEDVSHILAYGDERPGVFDGLGFTMTLSILAR